MFLMFRAIKMRLSIVGWDLPCSENLIDRRKLGICAPAVLKRLCAIFYPFFIQNSSNNFDTNIIETWYNMVEIS